MLCLHIKINKIQGTCNIAGDTKQLIIMHNSMCEMNANEKKHS